VEHGRVQPLEADEVLSRLERSGDLLRGLLP
jgi:hypothetical protein